MAETYDLIIKNGRIIDGTGNSWFQADIGIIGNQIAAISRTANGMEAIKVLDAAGMVVSPGFIDTHSHDDAYVLTEARIAWSSENRADSSCHNTAWSCPRKLVHVL